MKKTIGIFLIFYVFLSFNSAFGQEEVIRQKACDNPDIKAQADSIKKLFIDKGWAIIKEASVTMESQYEMPIIFPLYQGTWYEFVFIGEMTSRLYEVRMYDWEENQVVYQKKMWGDVDGNIISFTYIPTSSQQFMIKPLQVNKKKKGDLCGYVILMKRIK
jgi:hypothetical protein